VLLSHSHVEVVSSIDEDYDSLLEIYGEEGAKINTLERRLRPAFGSQSFQIISIRNCCVEFTANVVLGTTVEAFQHISGRRIIRASIDRFPE